MSRDFSTVVDDFAPERPTTRTPGLHFDVKRFISLRLLSVIIIGSLLCIPFAVVGWFAAPDVYTASAVIQFSSVDTVILDSGRSGRQTVNYGTFVGTELARLQGHEVLGEVLKIEDVQQLKEVAAAEDKLAYLSGTLSTSRVRNSELVNVYCTMKSRKDALLVLGHVIKIYHDIAIAEASGADTDQLAILSSAIEIRNRELDMLRRQIQETEGALGPMMGGSPGKSNEAEQFLDKMLPAEERVSVAENIVADLEEDIVRLDALQQQAATQPNTPIFEFNVESRVKIDPKVTATLAELNAYENRVRSMKQSHREGHPALTAAQRELETVRASIAEKEALARQDALNTTRGQLNLELEKAKRAVEDEQASHLAYKDRYDAFVASQEDNLEIVSQEQARVQMLKERAEGNRQFITGLEAQERKMQLDQNAPPRVRIASDPYAPFGKDRKAKLVLAALGVIGAFGLGLLYGVARELLDQQVRTRHDLARISDLPTIASIPHLNEDRFLGGVDCAMLMAQHPNSTVADEYRRILARILFPEDNAAEISSLLVVSASTKEGKTSIAANLAVALEQANRRVLLIDLSSQKPDIEKKFGLTPGPGLSELLQSKESREDLIRRTAFENLGIVGPGTDANGLAGRLASREMMDFMEWADEHFDHIIVDTPPLLLMSDAKLLAPAMDGVLFVVGVGTSTLGMVSRCLRDMEQLRANVIGIALNGIRSLRGGYLKKNQSLFYAYTERDAEVEEEVEGTIPEINVLEEEVQEPVDAEVVLLPFDEKEQ